MKKGIKIILMLIVMVTLLAVPAGAADASRFKVLLNEETITFQPSVILENARLLIPLNGFFEKLDARVTYDKENNKRVFIEDNYTTVEMTIGSFDALVHKKYDFSGIPLKVKLDAAPKSVNGIVYVPIRFVAESLGAKVDFDAKTKTASVSTDSDIISVERPAVYTIIAESDIQNNAELLKWFEENYKTKGIYSFKTDKDTYVLVSAGERMTGGYGVNVESATIVSPGSLYLTAEVTKPAQDAIVTMAITYPNVLLKVENELFDIVDGDIRE